MRLTIEVQRRLFREYAREAWDLHTRARLDPVVRDRVLMLAEERLLGVGVEDYGDDSWHLSIPELVRMADEERADEVFYGVVPLARRDGRVS